MTCAPKNSNCSISGSGPSGNCSGSASSAQSDPLCTVKVCPDTFSGPYVDKSQITVSNCGKYVVPAVLLNAEVRNNFINAATGTTANEFDATTNAFNVVSTDPLVFGGAGNNGINSEVEVVVPHCADSTVCVDLSELAFYADGIYKYQTKVPTNSLFAVNTIVPGHNAGAPTTIIDNHGVTALSLVDFPNSVNSQRVIHKPRVTVVNRSVYPVYVASGNACKSIENVSDQVGVRPRENLHLEYNPVDSQWNVVSSSC
jgi:hypothetical protein